MNSDYQSALVKLRTLLVVAKGYPDYQKIVEARDVVLAQYGPVFKRETIASLTEEVFKSFLRFENNRHWSGLHRQGSRICSDMVKLRETLAVLVDEEKPIQERLDECVESIFGLGRAVLTSILLIAYPDKYGVWNNTSEGALRTLKIWPESRRGASFGERYGILNDLLDKLARDLGIDLWTLDALFWGVKTSDTLPPPFPAGPVEPGEQRFGLEVHLHDFLFDNWDRTELGHDWELFSEPDNPDAGYEFPTDVGEIDLLARHRREKRRWLVVELKREQTSDDTVGQILRYMGWVRQKLAGKDDQVEGVIIARTADERLRYAISELKHVSFLRYEVSFRLIGSNEGQK